MTTTNDPVTGEAADDPADVPGTGQAQLLLGDHDAPALEGTHLRDEPCEGAGHREVVVPADPLSEQVVRREALGVVAAAGEEHAGLREGHRPLLEHRLHGRRPGLGQTDVEEDVGHQPPRR